MEPTFSTDVLAQSVDPDRAPRIFLSNEYPKQVWYFMGTFIGVVAAAHFFSLLYAWTRMSRNSLPLNRDGPLRHGASWRRLPIALVNLFRTVSFRWSITIGGAYTLNVADFLLATMYLGALFTWTFINAKNHKGVKYDPKYWANRCAHIAGSQLPLMTAFGMKNNIIAFLTGVSFDKLEHLHRATARVICVMFWVHAFGRIVLTIDPDQMPTYWFRIGVASTVALTILCLLSVRPIRARNYEVFLYMHLSLGMIALAGAYIHSEEFGYGSYIWPSLFLWALDRAIRFIRIALVNSQLFKTTKPKITSTAVVSILSPHFLRIRIAAPPFFRWKAGQSAYVTIFGAYLGSVAEAHPFTISNVPPRGGRWETADEVGKEQTSDDANGKKDETSDDANKEKESSVSTSKETGRGDAATDMDYKQLTFILRVRHGFTKKLFESVLSSVEPTSPESATSDSDVDGGLISKSFQAFVDGPYSSPPNVRGYETVVFICGGSGVSFVLPLFLDIVQAAQTKVNPRCKRIVFVWAIHQINWIADPVTHALQRLTLAEDAPTIDIRLHVTAAAEDTQSLNSSVAADLEAAVGVADNGSTPNVARTDSTPDVAHREKPDSDSAAKQRLLATRGVQLVQGRPDITSIVQTEIAEAREAVGITVCGTTELADSVRNSLRDGPGRFMDVLRGGPSVVLHVEGFGTA
ncbi:hypothetical protein C8R43DRAFT_952173 [Mycena crocata]|nr:hypothetical protein C8R43DRAFT_952173 [Mycena crocata]